MTAITFEQAKKTISCVTQAIALLVMLDLMILFVSLAQTTTEDRSGYWSPFWQTQAQMVLRIVR